MRYWHTAAILAVLVLVPSMALHGQDFVQISEFMAINHNGLDDEDRNEEDWIEIHNAGLTAVNLEGWFLTDKADNLTKWVFPAVMLGSDAYLVVFASEKDRTDPAGQLHTNFKLSGSGEYLALIRPDGITIASEFAPAYPIQVPDISYGLMGSRHQETLIAPGAAAKALVPTDNSLEPQRWMPDIARPWTLEEQADRAWLAGTTGVGYDYSDLIGLDTSSMRNVNETVYIRIPFEVDDPSAVEALTLRMRYEDGMIAYINGQEVARDNAPPISDETWNSGASATRSDTEALIPVDFDIPNFDFLHVGTNVLAIQGLNSGLGSSDLLILPELIATISAQAEGALQYFPMPTPGQPNNNGVEMPGPTIAEPTHDPAIPDETTDLLITARIEPTFAPVASSELHYRVMYEPEVTIPFLDYVRGRRGAEADGIYEARIPAGDFAAGEMVRWYITVTDTEGRVSRWPSYLDHFNSPQYTGTIVYSPNPGTSLPILHWFVDNPSAANTDAGTRCSIFYDGIFYDNVLFTIHGQSSRGFPKKSYNVDFHPGHNFKWAEDQPRADDINLMTTYPDKAQMRNILAYETYRDADCAYHWVFPVRVQQNGSFWGTAHVMENGDEDWLIRMGINANGALYKMYNSFTSPSHATSGAEKKTRKNEDNADLLALYEGLNLSGEDRRQYLYDNVDVAQVVNFLAAMAITGDTDCCHKNYYLYRDTGITNEWQMWPWDVDLSFGRRWISSMTYWDQDLITNTPLFVGGNSSLPRVIFDIPETKQMYLRRVRTLMDELLKPPDTQEADLYYEPRMDELAELIAPDAALDAAMWGSDSWGNGSTSPCCPQSLMEAVEEMKSFYLPERRYQLYSRRASGTSELPNAQPTRTVISFGTIESIASNGNQDQEYIELRNANSIAVDISGWTINVGNDAEEVLFTFRGGTVIPANDTLYLAADRPTLRARRLFPKGGQGLFVVGNYNRPLSARGEVLRLIDRQGWTVSITTTPARPSDAQSFLRITELMYHPPALSGDTFEADEYEFIELKNIGPSEINLDGVRLTEGITFDFTGSGTTPLPAGGYVLVVKNITAFTERYGIGLNIAGQYTGALSNSGERLQLVDARNEEVLGFSYDDGWYSETDGDGFSLTIVDENASYDTWGDSTRWRPSTAAGGSPGTDD